MRPLIVRQGRFSKLAEKALNEERLQSSAIKTSLRKKLEIGAKIDLLHQTNGKTLVIHPTGSETIRVLSFEVKGEKRTLKVLRKESELGVFKARKRFKNLKKLQRLGAPVVRPLELHKKKNGDWVWIEEYGGLSLRDLKQKAETQEEHKELENAVLEKQTEVNRIAGKNKLRVKDVKGGNALINPVTGEIKFTDINAEKI